MDVLCQAKSGMGKTAVFVLATLQQLEPVTGQVGVCPAASYTLVHSPECLMVYSPWFNGVFCVGNTKKTHLLVQRLKNAI